MSFETRLFINNKFVSAKSGQTFRVHNPATEALAATVEAAGPSDIDAAYLAAHDAFHSGPWRTMKSTDRAACMHKFADLIEAHADSIAQLETLVMGMPITFSRYLVKELAASVWRHYAGWCDKIAGESYPPDADGLYKLVQYEPLGVCAAISAWNGTQLSVAWKCAAAVAAGNTVVHKTSEKSPLGALALGPLIVEAGFPPGVINLVSGAGDVGAMLSGHMKIAKVSFTGSVRTGRKIQEAAARSNLKRVTLELGGKSPSIVFPDADMENALTHNSQSFLVNSGQACVAGSRLFVHESIAEKFVEDLKARFESLAVGFGDPSSESIFFGPLADKAQYERVMSFIQAGKETGASVLTGGIRKGDKGYFVTPTIFVDPEKENTIYKDEIFGPVLTVRTFKEEDEVIEFANDTSYGLAAYLFTSDISRALRVSGRLEAGNVNVNTTQNMSNSVPFGGYKTSGIGKESGKHGLLAYLNMKTIMIKV